MTTSALRRALAAKTDEARLDALLLAWRANRQPRIADLIDRISEPLVKAAGKVKGSSMPERTKQCLALCKTKNAVALGQVLATEWPGTWQPALPLLEAVLDLPDDPRVAAHFAKQVDATRYDTWTSKTYWKPLFRRLAKLGDVRQLALLEQQLLRAKGEYYARDMRPMEEAVVATLKAVKVKPLSKVDDELINALEAPFAVAAAGKKQQGKSGEALLAAVWANPSDLAARAVYGDWLLEQSDPRGELISLQSNAPTPKSDARIRSLIKKHWKTWLGPIADWFKKPPEFTLGFPSSAYLDEPNHKQRDAFRALMERPEWRTIETITSWPYWSDVTPAEGLRHPNFASVRSLHVADKFLPDLLTASPPLTELRLQRSPEGGERLLETMPTLKALQLFAADLPRFEKLLPRLERLHLLGVDGRAPVTTWSALERSPIVEVVLYDYETPLVRFSRAAGAPKFTTVEFLGDWASLMVSKIEAAKGCTAGVTQLGPRSISLAVDAKAAVEFEALLGLFPKLKAEVTRTTTLDERPHLIVHFQSKPLFDEKKVARVWQLVTEGFGATLDEFNVGMTKRPLGDAPVERLLTWSRNKKARDITLSGGESEVQLSKGAWSKFELPADDLDRYFEGLAALIDFVKPAELGLDFEGERYTTMPPFEKAVRRTWK